MLGWNLYMELWEWNSISYFEEIILIEVFGVYAVFYVEQIYICLRIQDLKIEPNEE